MAPTKKTFNEREMKEALTKALKIQEKLHEKDIKTMDHLIGKYRAEMEDLKTVIMDRNCLIRDMAKFIAKERT